MLSLFMLWTSMAGPYWPLLWQIPIASPTASSICRVTMYILDRCHLCGRDIQYHLLVSEHEVVRGEGESHRSHPVDKLHHHLLTVHHGVQHLRLLKVMIGGAGMNRKTECHLLLYRIIDLRCLGGSAQGTRSP